MRRDGGLATGARPRRPSIVLGRAWILGLLVAVMPHRGATAEPDLSAWWDPRKAEALLSRAQSGTNAWHRLVRWCDDFGPRFSGTEALERSLDWVLAELKRDGFDAVRGEEVMVPRWVRGAESVQQLQPVAMAVPVLGLGGTTNTPAGGIEARVLVVTNFAELTLRAAEAKGRIVVFNPAFTSYGEIVRFRYIGAVEAAKVGAVASLVRSVTPFSLRTPHTGAMGYAEGVARIPHAAIPTEDADRWQRWQERGVSVVLRLELGARQLPDVPSRNVIAEWRGRERPDEVVVVGGHSDSWDVGQGALDDAGGCVAAWEALRLVREIGGRPRRTLRLVLWTNEENGLRGARAYAARYREELGAHSVAIESDTGIGPVRGFAFTGSAAAQGWIRAILRHLAPIGADQFRAGAGGSDLVPLVSEGVPTMDLWTDRRDYFWFHHSAADTVDKVDPGELNRCVAALAVMLYGLGEMPAPLPR